MGKCEECEAVLKSKDELENGICYKCSKKEQNNKKKKQKIIRKKRTEH
jgi:hypothetical protein